MKRFAIREVETVKTPTLVCFFFIGCRQWLS
jgi:hypothetical protein